MNNLLRGIVKMLAVVPVVLCLAVSAAQADKVRIAIAETPSDEMAALFVALDRAKANGLDYGTNCCCPGSTSS